MAGTLIWSGVVGGVFLWVFVSGLCAGLISFCVIFRAALLGLLLVLELSFWASLRVGVCLGCQSGWFFCVRVVSGGNFGVGWFVCTRG